jgi:hypothetical protein
LLCSALFSTGLQATHLVGGNVIFKHVGGDRYLLGLEVMVDCYNGSPAAWYDIPLFMGMYARSTNSLVDSFSLTRQPGFDKELPISKPECAGEVAHCLYLVRYSDTFSFSAVQFPDTFGYYFSWERCCRNNVIVNIVKPEEAGIAFMAQVPPFSTQNSLPVFSKLPLNLLCIGNVFKFNFNITDADGDRLVISLTEPLQGNTNPALTNANSTPQFPLLLPGPYQPVTWSSGYSASNVMDANPVLQIDSASGELVVGPRRVGDYVFAVKVEEYRNGKKIGELIREMQYKVTKCSGSNAHEYDRSIDQKVFTAYPGQTINIKLEFNDLEKDSLFAEATSSLFDALQVPAPLAVFDAKPGKGRIKATFTWTPDCHHAGSGLVPVTIDVRDNGCPFPTITRVVFYVEVLALPLPVPPSGVCLEVVGMDSFSLKWQQEDPQRFVKFFVIERKDAASQWWQAVDTLAGKGAMAWTGLDTQAVKANVCYRVRAGNRCGGQGGASDSFCTGLHLGTVPDRPVWYNLTVNDRGAVALTWHASQHYGFHHYHLHRATNTGSYISIALINNPMDTFFVDSLLNTSANYYRYYLAEENNCGLESPASDMANTILLSGQALAYFNQMEWNPFDLWQPENYVIEGLSQRQGMRYAVEIGIADTVAEHGLETGSDGLWSYRVAAVKGEGSDKVSYSNTLVLEQQPVVWIPNAFSPDNNGLNEIWKPWTDFVDDYLVRVFNRWGQEVFMATDPEMAWELPKGVEGSYFYTLHYRSLTGKIYSASGSIYLLR